MLQGIPFFYSRPNLRQYMADFTKKSKISVTCPYRMASYLKEELEQQNFPILKIRKAGVETEGTLNDCMQMVLTLRMAHRVHFLLDEFRADQTDQMYDGVNDIPWEKYINTDGYLSVTSHIDTPSISDTRYANLACKDAIVDRIRSQTGTRPDSGSDLNHTVIFLYWKDSKCRIFLDTSGESLSRRGYRTKSHTAPLQETLAASIIKESRWKPGRHFINPMCGSGTLAIEAALMALKRPAGTLRPNFGIKHINGFDPDYWNQLRSELKFNSRKDFEGKIIATDRDPKAVKAARKNAQTAGIEHLIEFDVCNFEETPLPDGNGVVILNPPYGERLGERDNLQQLYTGIGDFFKNKCTDYTGYVFTGNLELAKHIGLRTNKRTEFYNSTLDCRLLEFELYEGSRN